MDETKTIKFLVGRTADLTGICACNACDEIRISVSAQCSDCGHLVRGLKWRLGRLRELIRASKTDAGYTDYCASCYEATACVTPINAKTLRAQL
jgi:hypothetical protein